MIGNQQGLGRFLSGPRGRHKQQADGHFLPWVAGVNPRWSFVPFVGG